MYQEAIEIYSYATNKVVLRVPWRRYPAILIQGDDLSVLAGMANRARSLLLARFRTVSPDRKELAGIEALCCLQDELRALLTHYNRVTRNYKPSDPLAMMSRPNALN